MPPTSQKMAVTLPENVKPPEAVVPMEALAPSVPAVEAEASSPAIVEDRPIQIIDEAEEIRQRKEAMTAGLAARKEAEAAGAVERKEREVPDSLRPTTWPEFEAAVLKAREPDPKPDYIKPEPTERQRTQTEIEMEAGRKRSEYYAAQAAVNPRPVDPSDKLAVPVPVNGEYQHETAAGKVLSR